MIKKALKYFKAVAKRYSIGKDVTGLEYDRRLTRCEQCPYRQQKIGKDTCGKCGCNLVDKAKWSTESCPIGRWKPDYILNTKKRSNQ